MTPDQLRNFTASCIKYCWKTNMFLGKQYICPPPPPPPPRILAEKLSKTRNIFIVALRTSETLVVPHIAPAEDRVF